jgi:hypothetical protein
MIGVKFRADRTDDLRLHRSRRLSTTTLLGVSTRLQVGIAWTEDTKKIIFKKLKQGDRVHIQYLWQSFFSSTW